MAEYIDREAFRQKCVEVLEGIRSHPAMTLQEMHVVAAIDTVCQIIDDMPAADVRHVARGHWITWEEAVRLGDPMLSDCCSVCHALDWDCTESRSFNFCPNCGADMWEATE